MKFFAARETQKIEGETKILRVPITCQPVGAENIKLDAPVGSKLVTGADTKTGTRHQCPADLPGTPESTPLLSN